MKAIQATYQQPYQQPDSQGNDIEPEVTHSRNNSNNELTVKETLLYTAIGIALLGGVFFVGRSLYRNLVSNMEERRSMDTDSAANYAKRIRMAFENDGWWGTDEQALRQVLREIQTQEQWQDIGISYQRLFNTPLMRDMQDELTSTEYSEMMAIIAGKPGKGNNGYITQTQIDSWAKRLNAAFTITYWIFPGTDEDAVRAVFSEIPSQSIFVLVTQSYARQFGTNFMDDFKSDMNDYKDYMKIITSKPQ